MFEQGKLYRHVNSLDLDLRVCTAPEDKGDKVKLRVMYWHRNYKQLLNMHNGQPIIETVHVKKVDYPNWQEVEHL